MESTFYLFGGLASDLYHEGGVEALLLSGESYGLFQFVEGQTRSRDLAEAIVGWDEYVVISEEEYLRLKN